MDQRSKQGRNLIRSGLVVIAGDLADNIEQPLSLGAVLAWTGHHDLRLPGYSLLKRHVPRASSDALHPRASPGRCYESASSTAPAANAMAELTMRIPRSRWAGRTGAGHPG